MDKPSKAVGILLAGTGINLSIGFLYAWSVFKKAMVANWGWTHSEGNAAYTVAIVMWAVALLAVLGAGFGLGLESLERKRMEARLAARRG